jgi:mannosyltransferase OCH1-like enzyme
MSLLQMELTFLRLSVAALTLSPQSAKAVGFQMIPKLLHYCWFGKGPIPEDQMRCIATWRHKFSDFEIVRWDETNSPVEDTYLRSALSHGNWANASNYVRAHALYEHGGVYLDTDVQVLRPFDALLSCSGFLGFQYDPERGPGPLEGSVNTAVMGFVPRHPFVADLIEAVRHDFTGTERANLSGPRLASELLIARGLSAYSNKPIKIDEITLYPLDYFYPYCFNEPFSLSCITENTYAIHHWAKSWVIAENPTIDRASSSIEATRDDRIDALENELKRSRSELKRSRGAHRAFLSSTSWKITAPLRAIFTSLRGKNS